VVRLRTAGGDLARVELKLAHVALVQFGRRVGQAAVGGNELYFIGVVELRESNKKSNSRWGFILAGL
jgi:hypothetical protein